MGPPHFPPKMESRLREARIHKAVACASSLGSMTSRTSSRNLRHFDAKSAED